MIEVVQEGGLLGAASDEDTLKKKFKSTAQIAALLSSGSSSGSVASAMERKSSGKRSTGTKKSSGTDLKSTTQDDAKGFDIIFLCQNQILEFCTLICRDVEGTDKESEDAKLSKEQLKSFQPTFEKFIDSLSEDFDKSQFSTRGSRLQKKRPSNASNQAAAKSAWGFSKKVITNRTIGRALGNLTYFVWK